MKTVNLSATRCIKPLATLCLVLLGMSPAAQAANSIPVSGSDLAGFGVAGWNADGLGPEIGAVAHDLPWTTDPTDRAFHYVASREYGGIDGAGNGALQGTGVVDGFTNFVTALGANGFTINDFTVRFGLMDLGTDTQGVEWDYNVGSTVETRSYNSGSFIFRLNGQDMVGGVMPRLQLNLTYNNLGTPFDDQISGFTDVGIPTDMSGGSSPQVQAVAAAFLADVGSNGVQLNFDSFQPAVLQYQFAGSGRYGAFFDAPTGSITSAPEPTALMALGLGGMVVLLRRRRR